MSSMIFECRIFVESKNLGKVMWLLDGLVAGVPQLVPVRGAKVTRKGEVKQAARGGSMVEVLTNYISDNGLKELSRANVETALLAAGYKSSSVQTVITALQERKVVGRAKKRGAPLPVITHPTGNGK